MKFPTRENDVVALAEQMIAGFTEFAGDFPSVTVAELTSELANFKEARDAQESMQGQTKIATTAKSEDFTSLIEQMKEDLTKAELDSASTPQNLAEIGWGPRQEPTPIQPPGYPGDIRVTAEGVGEIWLSWDKPSAESGGEVRNYLVEKAEMQASGTMGPWTLVDTVYNNEAHLTGQPSNLRMLYRVKASNGGGVSAPSNTLLVVLP